MLISSKASLVVSLNFYLASVGKCLPLLGQHMM